MECQTQQLLSGLPPLTLTSYHGLAMSVFKRNENALSLNAIVDLRRHEITFWNISQTIRASNLNIRLNVPHDRVDISTGNYVTIFFRSAENRTNVSIFGLVRVVISR